MPKIGVWFKSSKSGPNCDNCVEVQFAGLGQVLTRDSKDPAGPVHTWKPGEWTAFIEGAKAGEFDLPDNAR